MMLNGDENEADCRERLRCSTEKLLDDERESEKIYYVG